LFLSIFKYYCIVPVFIFDGKPPAEKTALLKRRYCEKRDAQTEYAQLESVLQTLSDPNEIDELMQKMNNLKKKMLRVTYYHIDQVVELIKAFGFEYYFAPQEADQLCAYLTITKNTYAVLSDDMDLLVAGCPFVIRNMSLANHDAILYDTSLILNDLQITLPEFREIIVVSGTDYDVNNTNTINIRKSFEYYKKYKENMVMMQSCSCNFYNWLIEEGIIQTTDFDKICNLFDITYYANDMREFLKINIIEKTKMSVSQIKTIMRKYKFIFV
jgi:5'-3' exonuclease